MHVLSVLSCSVSLEGTRPGSNCLLVQELTEGAVSSPNFLRNNVHARSQAVARALTLADMISMKYLNSLCIDSSRSAAARRM